MTYNVDSPIEGANAANVKVDAAGRVVIPAELRQALGITPGQKLILTQDESGLRLQTFEQAVRSVQAALRPYRGESVVDELIAERRAEAAREDSGGH